MAPDQVHFCGRDGAEEVAIYALCALQMSLRGLTPPPASSPARSPSSFTVTEAGSAVTHTLAYTRQAGLSVVAASKLTCVPGGRDGGGGGGGGAEADGGVRARTDAQRPRL